MTDQPDNITIVPHAPQGRDLVATTDGPIGQAWRNMYGNTSGDVAILQIIQDAFYSGAAIGLAATLKAARSKPKEPRMPVLVASKLFAEASLFQKSRKSMREEEIKAKMPQS